MSVALTLLVVLALVVAWLCFALRRLDAPNAITDHDIDADLHHHH